MKTCPYCGSSIEGQIYRQTACGNCKRSLHTCRACKFYHQGSHYDCLEDVDEFIQDKERENFCDSFILSDKRIETVLDPEEKKKKDRAAFDALFKL